MKDIWYREDFVEWRFHVKIALIEFAQVAFIGSCMLMIALAFGLHIAGINIGE